MRVNYNHGHGHFLVSDSKRAPFACSCVVCGVALRVARASAAVVVVVIGVVVCRMHKNYTCTDGR